MLSADNLGDHAIEKFHVFCEDRGIDVPGAAEFDEFVSASLSDYYADPFGYVMFAFPWGKGQLVGRDGPDDWQRGFLDQLGGAVKKRGFDGIHAVEPIRFSTASGHGIGKSALTAWLIKWIMDTRPFAKGVVTANTAPQLRTKTWAELGKWHKMSVTAGRFKYNSGQGNMSLAQVDHVETWRCDAQTCREENSESFAGLHAANSTPFYIFDEASAVPDKIYEVREGGTTDGEPMTFDFGNPTRNTGAFFRAHNRLKHRYITRRIDSRTVKITNKTLIRQWVDDYGEDSDFVRVRVRGMFPRAGSMQFIPSDTVAEAIKRSRPLYDHRTPIILGVDVARFGDDRSVLYPRIGRDARGIQPIKFREIDTVELANRAASWAREHQADAIVVDGGGVGGGVVDLLRRLDTGLADVYEVQFGGKADGGALYLTGNEGEKYSNKAAEIWAAMRSWIKSGGVLPDDPEMIDELTAREYGYRNDEMMIQLESKRDMKKRGLASPDIADALALTFAYHVERKDHGGHGFGTNPNGNCESDFDPYA